MAIDKIQDMMLKSLRGRHMTKVRQDVETLTETAGWLLRDLDKGQLRGDHARALLAAAQEIVLRTGQLETLREASEIYEASTA